VFNFLSRERRAFQQENDPMATHPPPTSTGHHVGSPSWSRRPSERQRESARAGDGVILEVLYSALYGKLCAFARSYVRCSDTAEELVQEVFVRLWRQHSHGRSCSNPRAYLFTSVRNQALKHLAHERVVRHAEEVAQRDGRCPGMSEPLAAADDELQATELAAAFRSAVDQLPGRCREAFRLHHHGAMSYVEIAAVMGTTARTAETQVVQARRVLRQVMASWFS
jgi:RNA polymerase sigma-70 factor, ECF subfamily